VTFLLTNVAQKVCNTFYTLSMLLQYMLGLVSILCVVWMLLCVVPFMFVNYL